MHRLGQLNNFEHIFQVAPALTNITSNFNTPKPPIQSKSVCHPPTTQERSRPGGAPGLSEGERGTTALILLSIDMPAQQTISEKYKLRSFQIVPSIQFHT
jgi:hypothetical protein